MKRTTCASCKYAVKERGITIEGYTETCHSMKGERFCISGMDFPENPSGIVSARQTACPYYKPAK